VYNFGDKTMNYINYAKISPYETALIGQIVDRVLELADARGQKLGVFSCTELEMDLCAAHLDTPMELHRLLSSAAHDLLHDVLGIHKHLNRKTGKLEDCFLPRCALPTKAGVARHV
jgi:hypothetical protein